MAGAVSTVHSQTLTQRSIQPLATSSTTDQHGVDFAIGGLSGITYAGGSTFWAVMDNSDTLVRLEISFAGDGSIATADVAGGLRLSQLRDHEGIAIAADGLSVYVSEETTPAVHQYRLSDGALLATLPLPAEFASRRANLGLESLSRQGNTLWTAAEEALGVDGPLSDPSSGTTLRLLRYDLGEPVLAGPQYAYTTAPIHTAVNDGPRDASDRSRSGLADLVALPDGRLLALERSFARADFIFADAGSSFETRIYLVDPQGASDVSSLASLAGESFVGVDKSVALWTNVTGILGGGIGNLEGLALGPQLPNGNWTLLGIVDNGDGVLSGNTLVSFELAGPVPEPSLLALGAWTAAAALLRRSRRS